VRMENAPSTHIVIEDTTRRERAKEKLYVTFQAIGWGTFISLQFLSMKYFPLRDDGPRNPVITYSSQAMVAMMGVLLTHYVRPLISRWNWKQLGWLPLLPRVFGMSSLMSLVWVLAGYGYFYGVLRCPWPSMKFTVAQGIFFTWLNGLSIFICW